MKKIKFKYVQKLLRPIIFETALLFCVFAFSGFNLQIYSTLSNSVTTELVETRTSEPDSRLEKNIQKFHKTFLYCAAQRGNASNLLGLLNYANFIKTKFKSYQSRLLLYEIASIKIHFNISYPFGEDDIPSIALS